MCNFEKVLIIDDDDINRFITARVFKLTNKESKTSFASNGQEGLEKALKEDHHIICIDINMPIMDGFEFARRFRESKNSDTKIIGFSNMKPRKENSLDCFDHFIEKPLTQAKLEGILC